MKQIRTLLSLLALTHTSLQCGTEVLSCVKSGDSSIIQVCDFFNFYSLNLETRKCEQNKIQNCLEHPIKSGGSICNRCSPGYTVNNDNTECVQVPEENMKDNCLEYQNQSLSCFKCSDGYFIMNGECVSLAEKKILNCVKYSALGVCSECVAGMYLFGNLCKPIKEINNCFKHTRHQCVQCMDGYYKSPSGHPIISVETESFDFLIKYNMAFSYWSNSLSNSFCQKGNIQNCVTYKNESECIKCETDFYVNTNSTCSRVQDDPMFACEQYSLLNTCIKCQFEYYLNMNECKPVTSVQFCAEYEISQNLCKRCEDRYYLNNAKTCQSERVNSLSIQNCKTKFSNKDACETCEDGYSLSTNELKCLKNIDNCIQQLQSNGSLDFHTCNRCDVGYYLAIDTKSCVENKINDCKVKTDQKNECTECNEGYYYDPINVVCEKHNLDFCIKYQINKNECTKCSSLYYLDSIRCLPINSAENCYESDGIMNKCTKCKPLFYTDGATCPMVNSRLVEVIDSQCKYNTETMLNSNCSECNDGHFVLQGTSKAMPLSFFTENNCEKIDISTGNCIQCMENSNGTSGGVCSLPDNSLTTDCLQLKENVFQALGQNNCAKCRNPLVQYLNPVSHSCINRINQTVNENCETYPLDSDTSCQSCKTNFYPMLTSDLKDQCYLSITIPNFTVINNCMIYVKNTGDCLICRNNYELSSDFRACTPSTNKLDIYLDGRMSFISPPTTFDLVDNCSVYHQIDLDVIKCASCASGYVNIMDMNATEYAMDYNAAGFTTGLGAMIPLVIACVINTDSFKNASGGSINSLRNCEIGFQIESKQGFGCIKCKTGYNGKVIQATQDRDSLPIDPPVNVIGPCVSDTSLNTVFSGVGYHLRTYTDTFPITPYFNYTGCSLSTNQMVFNSVIQNGGKVELIQTKTPGNEEELFYCSINNNNNQVSFKDRCHIFAFSSAPDPNFDISDPPVNICVACKAGYKAIISESTRQIIDCIEISFCVKNTNNFWLNACQNATNGYKLDSVSNNELIMFDEPLLVTGTISNCRVYSNDLSTCVICSKGLSVVNGLCIDPASLAQYNCFTQGAGLTTLKLDGAINANKRFMNYLFYLTFFNLFDNSKSTLCSSCKTNYSLAIDTDVTNPKCLSIDSVDVNERIEGCVNYALTIPVKCAVCNPSSHVLNTDTGYCVSIGTYANCKAISNVTVENSTSLECTACVDGFDLNSDKKCISKNCEQFYEGKCSLCKSGYVLEENNENLCIVSTASVYDPCDKYSPINKTCGKCKDGSVLFVYYENDGVELSLKGFSCEQGALPPGFIPGWTNYNLDHMFIVSTYNTVPNTVVNSLDFILSDEISSRVYNTQDPLKSPASQHCFTNRIVNNCRPENLIGGVYCTKCENGYYINPSNNSCTLGNIPFCNIYTTSTTCEKCSTGYFLSSPTTCTSYSLNLNCKDFKPSENKCETCPENHFLNSSSMCEAYRSDLNCKEFSSGENKCVSCNDDYWFNASLRSCEKRTAEGCLTINSLSDNCIECKSMYFKVIASQVTCLKQDFVEFCVTYFPSKRGCMACDAEHYLDPIGNKCKPKPNGIANCGEYTDTSICKVCNEGYYLSQNICVKVITEIENCMYYSSDGVCLTCKNEFFLDVFTSSCQPVNVQNCLEYISVDICKKCKPNFILKYSDNKINCEYSAISGCEIAIGGTINTCQKCEAGKALSNNKKSCNTPSVSIPNCQEYFTSDKCMVCDPGYIRSEDWADCVRIASSDHNCANAVIGLDTICEQCKPGYNKNNEGICAMCGGTGCAVCGPEPLKCLMCNKGYYMNTSNQCISKESGPISFQE